jgi:hypothetical protein
MRLVRRMLVVAFGVAAAVFYWAVLILDFLERAMTLRELDTTWLKAAQQWIQKHPDLGTQVIPLALLVAAIASLVATHVFPLLKRQLFGKEIKIIFPNECNLEHKLGYPFKRSSTPLFSGRPRDKRSLHQFYVGIYNLNPKKTLRNVRLLIECNQYGSVLSKYLLCERTGVDTTDISPEMTDYFLIGKGIDDSDVGLFHPEINPSQEYMRFFAQMEQNPNAGFVIFGNTSNAVLLKNNGVPLTVTVFADDTPPESQDFVLNARGRVSLHTLEKRSLFQIFWPRKVVGDVVLRES